MADYMGYRKADCIPDRMNPVDSDRFTKALPHATMRLPDWELFLSYFGESKVVFAKPLGEPDSHGNVECETITIPFA
jgi:hypothetical protein